MFGVLLASIGTLFEEISTSFGKLEVARKRESIYTFGFLFPAVHPSLSRGRLLAAALRSEQSSTATHSRSARPSGLADSLRSEIGYQHGQARGAPLPWRETFSFNERRMAMAEAGNRAPSALVGGAVHGEPITGGEPLGELFGKSWTAYVGREARNGYAIIRRTVEEDHAIVLAFSGAMATAGLTRSTIVPLIRAGLIDVVTTTHANVYHELQRLCTDEFREVDPQGDDLALRSEGWTRIYDHAFPEGSLLDADRLVQQLITLPEFQRPMTTPEFHERLAERIGAMRPADARFRSSLLGACLEARVPIFCGAPADASIFLNVAYLAARARLRGEPFAFTIDASVDIHEFAAYHLLAKASGSGRLSIIMFGGGVPKNYSLQPEPYLSQICEIETEGYDCDVQVCDAHVQNGGLSSCTANEAHTWGKTSAECVARGSQYVFADASLVAPLYASALLSELEAGTLARKTPRRFLDYRTEALRLLDAELLRVMAKPETPEAIEHR